jgi:hypothetical protein
VKEEIRDFASVSAAFGRVGRIQMGNPGYGRASFDLLRRRTLLVA